MDRSILAAAYLFFRMAVHAYQERSASAQRSTAGEARHRLLSIHVAAATELDANSTVVSSDCLCAYDTVSCTAYFFATGVQGRKTMGAGGDGWQEAGVFETSRGKDLAEQGLVAVSIGSTGEGNTEETGTEGSGDRYLCERSSSG